MADYRHPCIHLMGVLCFLLVFAFPSTAFCDIFSEYKVKAVFLFHLANFVQWPEQTLPPGQDFTIGIIGPDPFGAELERTVANETIDKHKIKIVRYTAISDLDRQPCQILFVNQTGVAWLQELHERLKGTYVLTVSDRADFVRQGGMINLLNVGNRIQLEINLDNANDSGLRISSKLLNLARLVRSPGTP